MKRVFEFAAFLGIYGIHHDAKGERYVRYA